MRTFTGRSASGVGELREFYNQQFKREIIKDEDRAYRWMARKLLLPFIWQKDILDVGCGGGYFLAELQGIASSATGLDISEEALKIASKTCPQAFLKQGSAESLPFEDEFFDVVVSLGSLEHFFDLKKALHEMARVVSRKGWVFVMVPNLFWYRDILSVWKTGDMKHRNQTFERFATPRQWRELFTQAGFKIDKTWKYNGISANPLKQWVKDIVIPENLSYHLIFGMHGQHS